VRVTLDVFSGRPNPSWELSNCQARELQARLGDKTQSPVRLTPPKLGFRGLIVTSRTDDVAHRRVPATFRLGAPAPAEAGATAERETAPPRDGETGDTAHWLLQTAVGSLHPNLLAFVSKEMKKPACAGAQAFRMGAAQTPATPPPGVRSSPYNPDYWDDPSVQPFNNCYNFAANFRSDTTAQPGRTSGAHYSEFSCWNVGAAASYDGVGTICQTVSNFVALVIWPGVDFHWYRLQAEGFWAHKMGHGQATNLESGGHVIQGEWTPENCGRGPYTHFCGYRYSPIDIHVI
jgi:hypothetical protein